MVIGTGYVGHCLSRAARAAYPQESQAQAAFSGRIKALWILVLSKESEITAMSWHIDSICMEPLLSITLNHPIYLCN